MVAQKPSRRPTASPSATHAAKATPTDARETIEPAAPKEPIGPGRAEQHILARAAIEQILAKPPGQGVTCTGAIDHPRRHIAIHPKPRDPGIDKLIRQRTAALTPALILLVVGFLLMFGGLFLPAP